MRSFTCPGHTNWICVRMCAACTFSFELPLWCLIVNNSCALRCRIISMITIPCFVWSSTHTKHCKFCKIKSKAKIKHQFFFQNRSVAHTLRQFLLKSRRTFHENIYGAINKSPPHDVIHHHHLCAKIYTKIRISAIECDWRNLNSAFEF